MDKMTGYTEYDGQQKEQDILSVCCRIFECVSYSKSENHVVSLEYAYDEYGGMEDYIRKDYSYDVLGRRL